VKNSSVKACLDIAFVAMAAKGEKSVGIQSLFTRQKLLNYDRMMEHARNIHVVFMGAILLYVIFGVVLKLFVMGSEPGFVGFPDSMYSMMLSTLFLVSIVLSIVVLFILPRQNSPQKLIKGDAIVSSEEFGQVLLKAHMTRVAMAQAIAIFGLLLFFLNGELLPLFAFSGITLVLLVLIFPRRAEWEKAKGLIEKDMA
jgi:hypothetical protein